jgi:hypothetical protein
MVAPCFLGVSASVQGASPGHECNQDAVHCGLLGDDGMLIAVADGHGSVRSFRSQQGAALAVQQAALQWSSLPPTEPARGVKRWLETSFPARLVAGWRETVRHHAEAHPLSERERARYQEAYRRPPPAELPPELYGTTLLAAAVRPGYLAIAQLGDGDVLLLDEEGHALRPLVEDPRHLANQTTSLSGASAVSDLRTSFQTLLDQPPAMILLSTDGYPNCFQTPQYFEQAAADILLKLRRRGLGWVRERLPGWLSEASRLGSGDDATVALLVREDLVAENAPTPRQEPRGRPNAPPQMASLIQGMIGESSPGKPRPAGEDGEDEPALDGGPAGAGGERTEP